MILANMLLALTVVVGLTDGQQLVVENPRFNGFIETRDGDAVLLYRQKNFSGEMKLSSVQRIDLGYVKGKPMLLTVTLKNGQKLSLESSSRNFVTVNGQTDTGAVSIKHPDPVSLPLGLSIRNRDRKADLTIQFLEFPH
jgi:hypothetical protein